MSKLTPYHHLVVDISSDEQENYAHSTPIKTLPLNMIETLSLSAESTKAAPGSGRDQDLSASTFESNPSPHEFGVDLFPEKIIPNQDEEAFTLESHTVAEPETSYYEEQICHDDCRPYRQPPF